MIKYENGGCLIQDPSELPNLRDAKTIYLDVETTSGDPKEKSINPWHHCEALGVCIAVDGSPDAWYVPIAHADSRWNINRAAVQRWLRDVVDCDQWVNHNIKYDDHVLYNSLGIQTSCRLIDTLTLSKLLDSDRAYRGGYGLEALSEKWLDEDVSQYNNELQPWLGKNNGHNKDYGVIPADVLGEYGCQDALTVKKLYSHLVANMPSQCLDVVQTEIALTRILVEMERTGLRIIPHELQVMQVHVLRKMLRLQEEISEVVGFLARPSVNGDCYEILVNHFGLPILAWTQGEEEDDPDKRGNPSFDKHALGLYMSHPDAPTELIAKMLQCRELSTMNSLFLDPYQRLQVKDRLHCTFNQSVRTGRMSCGEPNLQQLKKVIKKLIHTDDDESSFLSFDYSQIEFRIIVHYIGAQHAIRSYHEDPYTDFHNWVSELCGVDRKPAKNMNFCIGYGGGKKKMVSMLETDKSIIEGLQGAGLEPDVFRLACEDRATSVYNSYHASLPTLKSTSYSAANKCRQSGFVYNAYGRQRHLPYDHAHKAFNSLCQSTAADLMKNRMVALTEYLSSACVDIRVQVHDELLFHGPTKVIENRDFVAGLTEVLNDPGTELSVPIRGKIGLSRETWYEANTGDLEPEVLIAQLT